MFYDRLSAIQDFNKHKAFSNVHHSIYWFTEKEEKFNHDGTFLRWGPDYNTAVVNKINLDLDSYRTIRLGEKIIEAYTDEGLLSIRRFADWCNKHNYMREYVFSGGGFYGIVMADGHPLKLRDGMLSLGREADIAIDPATVGDTSRMRRVLNSFNFKEHRKCYCISLRESELSLDYNRIRALAEKPRFRQKFIYGTESFSLRSYKIDEDKIKKKQLLIKIRENSDADEILKKYGWETKEFCDPIKHILSLDYVGHYLRYELIKYLKSVIRMEVEDTVNFLAAILKEEGVHSFGEGQAKHVYLKNRIFNPKKLKSMGLCPVNCHKCQRIAHI